MKVPCQAGCGKLVDLEAADAVKVYVAVRRPNFHEVEIDACSPVCARKVALLALDGLVPPADAPAPAPQG